MGKRLSEADKAAALGEVRRGRDVAEVAAEAGVSPRSVYAWMKRQGQAAADPPVPRAAKWRRDTDFHLAPRPKKLPKQRRSIHLVSTIRTACLRILETEGIDALTTNHVAEVAGVGIASVYQYFPNKDAILASVYDEILEREAKLAADTRDVLATLNSRQILEYLIDQGIGIRRRLLKIAPDFYRKYHREFKLSGRWPYGGEPHPEGIGPSMAATGELFARLSADIRVPAEDLACRYIFNRGIGAIMDKAAEDNPELLDDPQFAARLKEVAVRFLLQPEALSPPE